MSIASERRRHRRILSIFAVCLLFTPACWATDSPAQFFYHPQAENVYASADAYLDWYRGYRDQPYALGEKPIRVGVVGPDSWARQERMDAIDALITAIEERGAVPVPLMAGDEVALDEHFMGAQQPRIDVLLYASYRLDHQQPERGRARLAALGVPVLRAFHHHRTDQASYAQSPGGLAPALTPFVVYAERDAIIEPLTISTRDDNKSSSQRAWPAQIAWRVERALAWARLARQSASERRLVISYWSEAGGRADLGGSPVDFLDVPASITALLERLAAAGYDTGNASLPSKQELAKRMAIEASNIGGWAPGLLADRVASGTATLVPEDEYRSWYAKLPAELRTKVEKTWGPSPGEVMVHRDAAGNRFLVIPRVQFGNVLIAPNPLWGYYENEKVLLSTGELPPHHQYLAFFYWLQSQWRADAWISLFTNLPEQPGKSQGPLSTDAVGVLLGALPHIHPERISAMGGLEIKRKTLAQTVSWYNVIVPTAQVGDLLALGDGVRRYQSQGDAELKSELGEALRAEVHRLGLATQIAGVEGSSTAEFIAHLEHYLVDLEGEVAPWGGRTLGTVPEDEALVAMVAGMLALGFDYQWSAETFPSPAALHQVLSTLLVEESQPELALTGSDVTVTAERLQMLATALVHAEGLRAAPRELDQLLLALDGQWIEPGPAGQPYRKPDVLPPGRSLYEFDPALMPTREAERVGVERAEALIKSHRDKNGGQYPRELGFVVWASGIATSLGVTEAQILHLLGTRPVRNARDEVVDVALISREELGRPRVDILVTTSGTYRDQFSTKADLLARAAALAAASPEPDNPVHTATTQSESQLRAAGADDDEAKALARARVFWPGARGAFTEYPVPGKSGRAAWRHTKNDRSLYLQDELCLRQWPRRRHSGGAVPPAPGDARCGGVSGDE